MVLVKMKISRGAAIKAGYDGPLEHMVAVSVSWLTEDQRDALARADLAPGYLDVFTPEWLQGDMEAAAIAAIDYRADKLRKERDEIAARVEWAVQKILAEGPQWAVGNVLTNANLAFHPLFSLGTHTAAETNAVFADPRLRAVLDEALEIAQAEGERRKTEEAEAQVHRDRQVAELRERQRLAAEERKAKEARIRAQMAAWLHLNGSDLMKRKAKRGLLADQELFGAIRDEAFARLDCRFERFQRITGDEVRDSYGYGDEVAFTADAAYSATDEQIEALDTIQQVMPTAKAELRHHMGFLKNSSTDEDERYQVIRSSILVTVDVGDLTVSREYAA